MHAPPVNHSREPRPFWYFFYGYLTDPKLLQQVAGLSDTPELIDAKIERKCIKHWSKYPVLCLESETIRVVAWYAPSVEAVERIRRYETSLYYDQYMYIKLKDDEVVLSRTFVCAENEIDLSETPEEQCYNLIA